MTTTPSPGLPRLDGVLNFREMGGLSGAHGTVAHGRLYRSGHLAEATDADVAALATLGLGSVVDFRLDADREGDGGADRLPDGVAVVPMPMTDPSGDTASFRALLTSGDRAAVEERFGDGKGIERAIASTAAQVTEPAKQAVYATFLRHVVDAEQPVLFHCSAGKDRAGWAATIIGMALGVSDDDLMEHYLLSNVHRPVEQRIEHYRARGLPAELMRPFLQVDERYLQAALDAVDDGWASREAYLADALGLDARDTDRLRERYLV